VRERERWVSHLEKMPMYTAYTGVSSGRMHANNSTRSVCHINRDEKEKDGRHEEKTQEARKRESEKNGERYVCAVELEGGKLYGG